MLEAIPLLGVLAAGILAGIASGLFGVGGGVLMVPAALYLIPDTDFHLAKAASLLVIVGSAGVGIWTHHQHKSVDLRSGLLLAAGGLGGSIASTLTVERISDTTLTAAFGILLAATGARLAFSATPKPRTMTARGRDAAMIALGLLAGLLAGAFGIGGGIVMVPGMVLAGIGIHLAVGTSLVAVLGNAIGATGTHLTLGYGPQLAAIGIPLALGAVPATYLGSKLAHKLHADRLRTLFGGFLILIGAWMFADATWI